MIKKRRRRLPMTIVIDDKGTAIVITQDTPDAVIDSINEKLRLRYARARRPVKVGHKRALPGRFQEGQKPRAAASANRALADEAGGQ